MCIDLNQPWHKYVDVGISADLLDYNGPNTTVYKYPCNVCELDTIVDDPEQFDPDFFFCGRSYRCCP